jgi:hypothetical protein
MPVRFATAISRQRETCEPDDEEASLSQPSGIASDGRETAGREVRAAPSGDFILLQLGGLIWEFGTSRTTGRPWCPACQRRPASCSECGRFEAVVSGTLDEPLCVDCTVSEV